MSDGTMVIGVGVADNNPVLTIAHQASGQQTVFPLTERAAIGLARALLQAAEDAHEAAEHTQPQLAQLDLQPGQCRYCLAAGGRHYTLCPAVSPN